MTVISYWHASLSYVLQLNGRYENRIKSILKEEGISEDFYYLAVAESGLQPLVSVARAEGYWQFLAPTAREFGLYIDREVDERYNIDKATKAAAAYFKKAYKIFDSWTMAAASFNIGMSNVKRRMATQSQVSYYDTQFPQETARYLYKALAFKIIMNDPEKYGFNIAKEKQFSELQYREVVVDKPVANWAKFAAEYNTNFKMLKLYNEWIRSISLKNSRRRKYIVKVPLERSREVQYAK